MKHEYPFVIRPLSGAEGSGYLIEYPDLPGCMSDGKTPEEAIANGRDAVKSYLFSCRKYGDKVPQPGKSASGQWRQRVPKSIHTRLVARAEQEGVSLNMLVTAMIAEGLGRRKAS
jgi:antitoxin HicB